MKILFVCTGNICRSPLAEGILRKKLEHRKVKYEVDSAGFESFHVGDSPDPRALKTADKHGVEISSHRARLFTSDDFLKFDRIYIMDDSHHYTIKRFTRTDEDMDKVDYLLNAVSPGKNLNVSDPWYSDIHAFEKVFHQMDEACEIIADEIATLSRS